MSLVVFKFRKYLLSLVVILFLYPGIASAGLELLQQEKIDQGTAKSGLFAKDAGFAVSNKTTLPTAVALVINIFIGLLGTIFLILVVISGWDWFTAQGDTKKIETAKTRMINAVIGLIIIVSAYAITIFVFRSGDELQLMNAGIQ